jgi:hypothetical protein
MTQKYLSEDTWSDCAPGGLQRVAAHLRGRRRREFLRRAGSVAAGVVVLGTGGVLATRFGTGTSTPDQPYGGIACVEVVRLMPRYRANELSADLAEKIQVHLAQCPECGKMARVSLTPTSRHSV